MLLQQLEQRKWKVAYGHGESSDVMEQRQWVICFGTIISPDQPNSPIRRGQRSNMTAKLADLELRLLLTNAQLQESYMD